MISYQTIVVRLRGLPEDSEVRQAVWRVLNAKIGLNLIIQTCPPDECEFWENHARELLLAADYILRKEGL
jgi:hypothetical protein